MKCSIAIAVLIIVRRHYR